MKNTKPMSWKKFVSRVVACCGLMTGLQLQMPAAHAGWSQVWVDDFNSFDTAKWSKGFAWGNTFGATPDTYYDPNNAFVSSGTLKLKAKSPGTTVDGKTYKWTGAHLNTYGKFSINPYWGYGYRIRVLAKLPKRSGINPAFWMLKEDSSFSWPPEIDIFEAPGAKNGELWWTVHYSSNGAGGSNAVHGNKNPGTVGDGKFHWYELQWWREGYSFRVDDVEQYSNWSTTARINANMYFLLGNAAHNNPGWDGVPASGTWTETMEVDRLEVYWWQ